LSTTASVSPTTSTTRAPTTPVEIPTSSSSTTQAPPETSGIGLLVAHANGIDLWLGEDVVAVLEGVATSAAFADGLGGVVFQPAVSGHRPQWDWGPGLPEPMLVWYDGEPTENSIMWLPSLRSPPQILVADDHETWIELVDVTTLNDRTVVVYEREVSLVDSCVELADLTQCYLESLSTRLTARDLETGQEWSLGRSGGFEWGSQVSIAGSRAAVNLSNPDRGVSAGIRLVDVSALVALDPDAGITSATSDEMTIIGLGGACEIDEPCDHNSGLAALSVSAISRDGSSLAFLEYYISCCDRPSNDTEMVVWDLDEGRETLRIRLGQDQWAISIDHNGADTLLSLDPDSAILIDAQGASNTLPPGARYSLWNQ
jgi:hypothetical protein